MPKEETVLKFNHGEKSMKNPFIIYADIASLLDKIDECQSNPEKPSKTTINMCKVFWYQLFTCCSFDDIKDKHNSYRGNYCIKNFSRKLEKHAAKIIRYEKKRLYH